MLFRNDVRRIQELQSCERVGRVAIAIERIGLIYDLWTCNKKSTQTKHSELGAKENWNATTQSAFFWMGGL